MSLNTIKPYKSIVRFVSIIFVKIGQTYSTLSQSRRAEMMAHLTCHQVQGFTRLATRYLSSDTAKEGGAIRKVQLKESGAIS